MMKVNVSLLAVLATVASVLPLSAAHAHDQRTDGRPEASTVACRFIPTPQNPAARPVPLPRTRARDRGSVTVILATNHGRITVRLDRANAPCAVHNLVHLVREDFYDRSRCWRLTNSARLGVLQCGDIWEAEIGGPGYRFADELTGTESYPRGTIAMGNQGKDTNGSEFFIVHSLAQIRPDYTVLGRVVGGMEVLDRIVAGGIRPDGALDGQPRLPVEIRRATQG